MRYYSFQVKERQEAAAGSAESYCIICSFSYTFFSNISFWNTVLKNKFPVIGALRLFFRFDTRLILGAILLAYLAYLAVWLWPKKEALWDLTVYYRVSRAYAAGANPYAAGEVLRIAEKESAVAGEFVRKNEGLFRHFAYPPLVLHAFSLISARFDFSAARGIFIVAKLIGIALLFVIWWRWILPRLPAGPASRRLAVIASLFMIYAWSNPIERDMLCGNISVFEQVLVWSALALYLRGRFVCFAILLALAAFPKGVPLVFLGLLAVPLLRTVERRQAVLAGLLGIALFAGLHFADYLRDGARYPEYLRALGSFTDESRGLSNAASLPFFYDVAEIIGRWSPLAGMETGMALWMIWGLAFGILLLVVFFRRGLAAPRHRLLVVMLATLFLAVTLPRLKDYSLILLLPAAWFFWSQERALVMKLILAVVLLFPARVILPMVPYYNFFLAVLLFFLALFRWSEQCKDPITESAA